METQKPVKSDVDIKTPEAVESIVGKDNKEKEDLGYVNGDPGAVRHGNFINYYAFNPASERISHLPIDIWTVEQEYASSLACLDIGCNSGVKYFIF